MDIANLCLRGVPRRSDSSVSCNRFANRGGGEGVGRSVFNEARGLLSIQ